MVRVHLEEVGGALDREEIEQILSHELAPDVFSHVLRTAEMARALAERHGVDPQRAETAALLHDIADPCDDGEMLALAHRYRVEIDLTEELIPQLLHGKVGAEILSRKWGISDEEILEAVRVHVSGARNMSPLAKIVFLADKLEPERDRFYGELNLAREMAKTDLDGAIEKLLAWRMSQLDLHGPQQPTENTIQSDMYRVAKFMESTFAVR
ncbi:MAG: bis(5'-nucleosyl)-tetraphosphatase (symmetrical) YqeK [Chloroflexi bacterium]|nr:bis(5'-nucleosyl)-tetraphosphatase (symmetrical) YqeK [Chloroflexota bacterium]